MNSSSTSSSDPGTPATPPTPGSTRERAAGAPTSVHPADRWSAPAIAAEEASLEARTARFSLALPAVLILLLALELWVRALPVERLAFGGVGARGDGRDGMAALILDAPPIPDVVLLGSSRVRDGLICSQLQDLAGHALGRPVTVRNLGVPDGANAEFDAIAAAILRTGTPSLVVVGIEPRSCISRGRDGFAAAFDTPSESWRRALGADRITVNTLRRATHATLRGVSRAYRFRGRFSGALLTAGADLVEGHPRRAAAAVLLPPLPLPATGGLAWNHIRSPRRSIEDRHFTEARLRKYLLTQFEGRETFDITDEDRAPLFDLIRRCRDAGAELVFVETPAPTILEAAWPPGTAEGFTAELERLRAAGATVVRVDDLGITLTDEHFREQSHLNLAGATHYGQAIARHVIIPALHDE